MVPREPCYGLASWRLKSPDTTEAPVAEFSKRVKLSDQKSGLPAKVLGHFYIASLDPDKTSGLAESKPVKSKSGERLHEKEDRALKTLPSNFLQGRLCRLLLSLVQGVIPCVRVPSL
jgi:hypothetical protein